MSVAVRRQDDDQAVDIGGDREPELHRMLVAVDELAVGMDNASANAQRKLPREPAGEPDGDEMGGCVHEVVSPRFRPKRRSGRAEAGSTHA
jgi:hypothetical protein